MAMKRIAKRRIETNSSHVSVNRAGALLLALTRLTEKGRTTRVDWNRRDSTDEIERGE